MNSETFVSAGGRPSEFGETPSSRSAGGSSLLSSLHPVASVRPVLVGSVCFEKLNVLGAYSRAAASLRRAGFIISDGKAGANLPRQRCRINNALV